jgi:putative colanic acid biosynthesis acetyltransferase WcaF
MTEDKSVRIISLANVPPSRDSWQRPKFLILLWIVCEFLFVTNSLQLSSRIRVSALRLFGANIGKQVIMRPRLRVKFPWNLTVGDNCWIGEGVWIHNQDSVTIGNDVCISQETFITTGSHAFRDDMSLLTKPILIESGVWICSRAIVTMGVAIGKSAVVPAGAVVSKSIPAGSINNSRPRFNA